MGNVESHGHSHDGKPCHGHGNDAHSHAHGAGAHNHQAPAAPAAHGHSHGGKPCHGHGGADHGAHNHQAAPAAHGHSHGGQPCHGHGGAHNHNHGGHSHGAQEQMLKQLPQAMQMRIRAVQLLMTSMLVPKLPIIFEKFHPSKEVREPKTASAGIPVPDNAHEFMSVSEFRDFVTAYLTGISEAEGHNVVRTMDIDEMTEGLKRKLPEGTDLIPQPVMLGIMNMVLSRTAMSNAPALGTILKHLGLEMKMPKSIMSPEDTLMAPSREYCRNDIMPSLVKHIETLMEAAGDSEDASLKVFDQVRMEIVNGLKEAKSANPVIHRIIEQVSSIDGSQMIHEFKENPSDKAINIRLFAHFINESLLVQMFAMEPQTAVPVVRYWGIDLAITADDAQ